MSETIALFSKNVALREGLKPATLLIENGRIKSILPEKLPSTKALPVRDAGESVIMPGIIDCSVHINEPGRADWEGFESATASAAAGGITTIIDMPVFADPPTTSMDALRRKVNASKGQLHVNCGLWGGIIPGNFNELDAMIQAGVMGFVAYLSNPGNDGDYTIDVDQLEPSAKLLAEHGVPLLVHALLDKKKKGQTAHDYDNYSYAAYLHSIPQGNENEAVKKILALNEKTGVRTHVLHLSSAEAIDLLKKAHKKGQKVTAETCPHYLFFSAEKIHDSDTRFKCTPPIREQANNLALWHGLLSRDIDFISSDHSPVPSALKELDTGNVKAAWGGIAALQFTLPVIWTLTQQRKVPLETVSQWLSSRPAEFLGLKSKGVIAEGFDADLVVWSPNKKMKANAFNIKSKQRITPYEGEMLSGVVEETWINGKLVYDRGDLPGSNQGRLLLRNID